MINILELFGGIGAPRKALVNLGVQFQTLDYVEINEQAVSAYNILYDEHYEPQDINQWKKRQFRGKVDILIHGSPCQDFSIAGNGKGGDKGSGTRSSLLWVSMNIIRNIIPRCIVWENVSNVLSKKHIHVVAAYKEYLSELGYTNQVFKLNAVNCGEIQSRERVIIISSREGNKVTLKKPIFDKRCLKDILEDTVDNSYFRPEEHYNWFLKYGKRRVVGKTGLIQAGAFKGFGSPYIRNSRAVVYSTDSVSPTLTTTVVPKVLLEDGIRELTPKECWLAMGFDETDFNKVSNLSNSALYRLAGNSMSVKMMEVVLKGCCEIL